MPQNTFQTCLMGKIFDLRTVHLFSLSAHAVLQCRGISGHINLNPSVLSVCQSPSQFAFTRLSATGPRVNVGVCRDLCDCEKGHYSLIFMHTNTHKILTFSWLIYCSGLLISAVLTAGDDKTECKPISPITFQIADSGHYQWINCWKPAVIEEV